MFFATNRLVHTHRKTTGALRRTLSLLLATMLSFSVTIGAAAPALAYEPTATDITSDFTDANFLAAVRNILGKDASDPIYDTDVSNVTMLQLPGKNISSLDGIEHFSALTFLVCSSNNLTTIDVASNTALEYLSCSLNPIESLDLSSNQELVTLDCRETQLAALDVTGCTKLEYIECASNQLTSLDVSNNLALKTLGCYDGQIDDLDVSANIALEYLECGYNQITSLDISNNPALTLFSCWGNQLTSLDVTANTALESLICGNNQLTSLDVTNNTELTSLNCAINNLTSLDLSANTALMELWCRDQQVSLTLDSTSNGYSVGVDMGTSATFSDEALSYASGVLTSRSSSVASADFSSPTGFDGQNLTGTLTLTYSGVSAYPVMEHFDDFTGSGISSARVDGDHTKFLRLLKDGAEVDPMHYTITQGSTIITFNEAYLKTLGNGTHWYIAQFNDGRSESVRLKVNVTSQSVSDNLEPSIPATGVNLNVGLWAVVLFASALGLLCLLCAYKRRQMPYGRVR